MYKIGEYEEVLKYEQSMYYNKLCVKLLSLTKCLRIYSTVTFSGGFICTLPET